MSHHIHPSARIASDVHLGPFVMIGPNVVIGSGTRIEGFASIGTPPEHRDHFHDEGPHGVKIGKDCVIREFVSINSGTRRPTCLADGVAMLHGSYAAHDVVVEDAVTISGNVMLGGHTWIGEGANLGLGVAVRQYLCVGAYAMVGMNSTVTRDLPPFMTAYGSPAVVSGLNRVGIKRAALDVAGILRWWNRRGDRISDAARFSLPPRESLLERSWREAVEARSREIQ